MQNPLECLNFIVGIVGTIVGILGAILAWCAYHHAKGAQEKSEEILEHLLKEVKDFDEFAKRANEVFLVTEAGTTMMSLISPAFAALSKTGDQKWFKEFSTRLNRLSLPESHRKLLVLVAECEQLVEWYRTVINAMETDPSEKLEVTKRVIKSLQDVSFKFKTLIDNNKCEFKTRPTTMQIFVRMDGETEEQKHRAAMFGILASDFHKKVPEMLGKENPTYDEMVKLSKGVYSGIQPFVREQEEIFNRLWKEEEPLNPEGVMRYFECVVEGLQKFQEEIEKKNFLKSRRSG